MSISFSKLLLDLQELGQFYILKANDLRSEIMRFDCVSLDLSFLKFEFQNKAFLNVAIALSRNTVKTT